jgi:hypothetical protein
MTGSASAAAAAARVVFPPHAGRHPEGVYVVVTGCIRVNPEGTLNTLSPNPALRRGSSGAFGGGGDGDSGGAAAAAAAAGSNGNAGAQFIGPGEAVGEDSVLRAGAYTRPLFSPTRAVSDTKYTLNNPQHPLTPPQHHIKNP